MARKVEKKYQHGTHVAEFVEEIPPLAEDRKTIFLPDTDIDRAIALGGRTLGIMLASIMRPLADKFGDEVWGCSQTSDVSGWPSACCKSSQTDENQ